MPQLLRGRPHVREILSETWWEHVTCMLTTRHRHLDSVRQHVVNRGEIVCVHTSQFRVKHHMLVLGVFSHWCDDVFWTSEMSGMEHSLLHLCYQQVDLNPDVCDVMLTWMSHVPSHHVSSSVSDCFTQVWLHVLSPNTGLRLLTRPPRRGGHWGQRLSWLWPSYAALG